MKYQKYEKYKISNNPWFSELPENWDVSRIKFNSILFGRIGYRGYSTDDLVDEKEGAITLSPSNMINGKLDFSKCTYLSWDKYNESPEIKMRDHDVVMVKTGSTIGKVSFAEKIEYPTTINPQLVLYKKIKCNPKFLFYYLFSKNAQDRIPLYNSGSTIPTMKQEDIGRFYLPMPSMNEQNSIVEFLDRETTHIDTLIEKKQKLIELLKEKRTALLTHAVTKGLNPDAKMKDSGIEWLGKIPVNWNRQTLKRIVKIPITDGPHETPNFIDEGIPFVSAEAIYDGKVNFEKQRGFISQEQHLFYSNKYKPKFNDIYLVKSGSTTGKVAIVDFHKEFNIWSPLAAIRCNNKMANPHFIFFSLQAKYFQQQVKLFWSFGTQPNIGMGVIGNLFVALPAVEEQKEIADFLEKELSKIDALVDKVEQAITKHQEYRTALISATVTGKIKVTQD